MLEYISSDRKTFDERYEEAISRIPLYTSDWTNFNQSDPGVTILEVLTGFETMSQEHIDHVPFRVRENLLKMIGFRIKKGRPARLLLSAEGVREPITLPANHRFVIGDLIFETNRRIDLDGARMKGVYSWAGGEFKDVSYLLDNETRVPASVFGKEPKAGNVLYFICDKLPKPGQELLMYVDLKLSANRNPLLEKMKNPFADVRFEVLTAEGYKECKVRDFTSAFLTSGEIRVRMPEEEAKAYEESEGEESINERDHLPAEGYVLRAVLNEACYDVAPRVTAIHPFLFEVWQKLSLSETSTYQRTGDIVLRSSFSEDAYVDVYCKEEKGSSYRKYSYAPQFYEEGRYFTQTMDTEGNFHIDFDKSVTGFGPERVKNCVKIVCYTEEVMRQYAIGSVLGYDNQVIDLPFDHLVAEGFSIIARRTDGEGGYIYDFVRPDYDGEDGLCYHLLENDGRILIEDAGDFIGADLFLANIAVTRGKEGNIRAGNELLTYKRVSNTPVRFFNPGPGTGGAVRETIDEVRRRFLTDMDRPYTAVTEKDYELLVRSTPGLIIKKARAYMDEEKNMVKLAVMPGNDHEFPQLTDYYKKIIMEHLESRRLLSTRIELVSPVYTRVNVTGTVYIKLNYENSLSEIERCIRERIDYLNSGKNFGDRLSFDDCFHAIEMLDCVENVYDLSVLPHSLAHAKLSEADIIPDENCLLYPGDIKIELVTYER